VSEHNDIAAILLAAGNSTRMGAFKPLLPFGQKTVIETCISRLFEGGVGTVVVVTGRRGKEVRRHLADLRVLVARNDDPESEMGVSIARGMEQIPSEGQSVIIALVDQPAIPSEVTASLIERFRSRASRIVVPQYQGRAGHPVLIDSSLRQELLHLDPRRGLRGLFDGHREEIVRVDVSSPYILRDMDTWDDYVGIYMEVFGAAPPPLTSTGVHQE
jgi:molybdenum cofactor cytidylyltransferase